MIRNPEPDEPVCFNCREMIWAVGVGQGVRCAHPKNEKDGKLMLIPSRHYTCEFFARKVTETDPEDGDLA